MGIKDINTFLKKKEINCFNKVPMKIFRKRRIAIDSLNWVFTFLGIVVKKIVNYKKDILEPISQDEIFDVLFKEFLNFNTKFLNYGITPVWIWDGVSQDNKGVTKVERRKAREKSFEKKEEIEKILKDTNPLERSPDLIDQYKKLLTTATHLKRSKIEEIKKRSLELGIPTITAEDEAENLGSSLAVEKIIAGIWSSDTDTYPLGAPLVVKKFEYLKGEMYINFVFTPNILKGLELNIDEFRDFCILLGTDFNDRLPSIGPMRSYELIKRYRCLEEIEKETKHNCYGLKYKDVRKQLCAYKTKYNGLDDLKINKSVELNFDYMNPEIESFVNLLKNTPDPYNL
jgi:flap endonuclease-1